MKQNNATTRAPHRLSLARVAPCGKTPRGFAIVEAVIAVAILSVLMVAALRAAGASGVMQYKAAERATALSLARGLMAEILPLPYQDPGASPVFGRETGEVSTNRGNYNDVDDYNGWNASPPQDKSGAAIAGMTNWRQSVTVNWVAWNNLTTTSVSETGVKRIIVSIQHNNRTIVTLTAVRTKAS